ncbi:MaoC family dehydratase [Vitreimonas flagellata]|uniref:MaoC family dehydratase n=1 Tax=Vitreimonas flagellata TaxID=2560861 RepID=UPI001074C4BB|nr:MaoC family dehydratase [Vitreimonas flagellata]
MTTKSNPGNFLEDFRQGQIIAHATPKTITEGDVALNIALTGSRYALFSADSFAQNCGLPGAPVDPLLVFHTVFGKTVPDISLNAVANLGYAEGRFLAPVFAGDTLNAVSEVLGVKQNSNGKTGVVTVRTTGFNQDEIPVLSYVRWVMVNKRDASAEVIDAPPKTPASSVPTPDLVLPQGIDFSGYDFALAGSPHAFQDYEIGEKIDHVDGMTVEEAEHQLATRLYQNTAKVHFDALAQKESRFGKRLIYGGVTISIARALAFNGLANAQLMIAINGGRHVNPLFAGDTLYAWSEVLAKEDLGEIGALRLRLVAVKNKPATDFPFKNDAGEYDPNVVLDFDYWAAIPKR